MIISQLKHTACPVRDRMSVEPVETRLTASLQSRPMWTECDLPILFHIPSHTGRGEWCERTFSTNILSRRDRKPGCPCPIRDKMSVENAGYLSGPVPSGTGCGDCHIAYLTARGRGGAVAFSTNILSRRDKSSTKILSPTGDRDIITSYLFHVTKTENRDY
jgi:hypothetical protein